MSELFRIAAVPVAIQIVLGTLMGVLPGMALSPIPPGPGVHPLSALAQQGRAVYVSEGCAYCHTQQVRPLPSDRPFGRPSAPGDFAYQTPELLGAHRTGPDLTNVGARQPSEVWQYIHLYNPRAVVPESIMPSFPWMFRIVDKAPDGISPVPLPKAYAPAHGLVVPTPQAQALFAYLMYLKQPPLPVNEAAENAGNQVATPKQPQESNAPVAGGYDASKGEQLFTANCAVCHQATGQGLPGAFPALKGDAVVNDADPSKHIRAVLFGQQGATIGDVKYESVMPAFDSKLSDVDVATIIDYERSSWGNHGKPVTAQDVAAERAKGK